MQKTNAMRLLDAAGIQYSTAEYEVDERDLSGVHAARMLNMPVERVFKTLVLRGASGAYMVCCIPVANELDLRKVARVSGEKKVDLIPVKDLPMVSGYVRGGCSPIGMKKLFPTYIDKTAELFDIISISAGVRGVQIIMKVEDLNRHIGAVNADLVVA
ncbi:MAG: Cys-tRNA(Pro) deacylase [Treponema sp.]|jgi:Cys-tRNA(Pro)/Cys-tRNA(Cys) deacylase|nr:Cys-tRNA(Pro) deacylase [Treponema sp.]